jgi:large subunit ribosomal protein L32
MPVPKRKRSRARRDKRFANKGMKVQSITACSNCKDPLATHQACLKCGFYKGKKVMTTKQDRSVVRTQARTAKAAQAEKKAAQTAEPAQEEK